MREAVRRQLLADMGITVWQLRAARPCASPQPAAQTPAAPPAAPPPAPPPAAGTSPDPESPATAAAAPCAEAPWSVWSLALGGTVMLVDGNVSRRDLRLLKDVAAVASGAWRSRAVQRRFDWPPPVAGTALTGAAVVAPAGAGARALRAFVDKDLADHRARLLLIAEPLAALLTEPPPGCQRMVMPAPGTLGRDAGAKRRLWQALCETALPPQQDAPG